MKSGLYDPSVKMTVSQVTSLVSSPTAAAPKKKPVNPHWGQSIYFDVPDPTSAFLYLQVFDTNDNRQQVPLGEVWIPLLGNLTQGVEDTKWYALHKTKGGEVKVGITPIDYTPPPFPNAPPSSAPKPTATHSTIPSGFPPGMPPSTSTHAPNSTVPSGFPPGMTPPMPRGTSASASLPPSSSLGNSSSNMSGSAPSLPPISRSDPPSGYPPGYHTPQSSSTPSTHSSIPSGYPPSQKPSTSSPAIPHVVSPVSPVKIPSTGSASASASVSASSSSYHQPQYPQSLGQSSGNLPSSSSNPTLNKSIPSSTPSPAPSSSPSPSLLRAESAGPYKSAQPISAQPQKPKKSLIAFAPQDLQRDYPHLAKGSYGIVYKGRANGIQGMVVIKDMEIRDQKSVGDWKKELQVMSSVSASPYIADVYGYSTNGNTLTIVMEYFPKGDLYGILYKKKEPLSMLQRMRMARHVALGVAFLHQNHFLHRDIKSMNILVADDYTCKLTDFGCAKLVSSDRQIFNTVNSGTPLWMAPEVKRGQYSYPADVYSMGLVLYELFEKQLPNYDQIQGRVIMPPSFQSASVIMPCLNQIPEQRPQAAQVVHVVDKMIKNVVSSVKDLLPKEEQEKLKREANSSGDDSLDAELMQLYQHLLHKPAAEVDALISKAYGIQILPQKSAPSFAQAPSPAPVPMQYGMGGIPGMPGIPGGIPMGVQMGGVQMGGVPMGMQGMPVQGMPMQGMPGGIPAGMPMGGVPMGGVPMGMPQTGFPPGVCV